MFESSIGKSGRAALAALAVLAAGCGAEDTGSVTFTTWGEAYIEDEIPADPEQGGFVDGWTLRYEKFLVNFRNIRVADDLGEVAATMPGTKLFDNKLAGVKALSSFADIPARAWNEVSYEIAPVTADGDLAEGAAESDRQRMVDGGYSLYLAGSAEKEGTVKRFAWGFAVATRYERCHAEQNGRDELGVIVENNAETRAELTTHGDHPFYDRLRESDDPNVVTSLRFDAIAEADADRDGEVTLAELDAVPLDVTRYNRSGLPAATLGAFVTELTRTVGHFRGEGECTISAL